MRRVALVLVQRGDRVLAVTRERPPLRLGLPGGGVEGWETYAQGAARELAEETGLVATGLRRVYEGWSEDGRNAFVRVFEAGSVRGELRPSHEGYPVWVPPRALAEPPFAAFPKYSRRMLAALRRRGMLMAP